MLRQQGRLFLHIERVESRLAQAGIVVELPGQAQSMTGLPIWGSDSSFLQRYNTIDISSFGGRREFRPPYLSTDMLEKSVLR